MVVQPAFLPDDRRRRREEADGPCVHALRLLTSAATDNRALKLMVRIGRSARDDKMKASIIIKWNDSRPQFQVGKLFHPAIQPQHVPVIPVEVGGPGK